MKLEEVKRCPKCGAPSWHYAQTVIVGQPDPNTWQCQNRHFFVPTQELNIVDAVKRHE